MVDWQVTAATVFCEEVDDEVTIIVKMEKVAERLVKLIGEKNLDKYTPGELLYS